MTNTVPPHPDRAGEMERLAKRVGRAVGPDRKLDALICAALRIGTDHDWGHRYPAWIGDADGRVHLERNGPSFAAPMFTASLDAAMGLVPEGAGFNLDRYWVHEGVRWKVEIGTGGVPEQPRRVFDCWDAHSAPLATCAAALRSLALTSGETE